MDQDSSIPGELHWEVGYFGKPQFRPALRSHGKDVNLPKELQYKKELQDDRGVIENMEEDAVHTPLMLYGRVVFAGLLFIKSSI